MFKVNWWRAFAAIPGFYIMAFGIIFGKKKVEPVNTENPKLSLNKESEKVVNK